MSPEDPGNGLNRSDRPGSILTGGEPVLDERANSVPLPLIDLRCDGPIDHDLDRSIGEQDVDQDPGIVSRIPDSQLPEHLPSPIPSGGAANQLADTESPLDREADLTKVIPLLFGNRLLNRVERFGRESPCR